MSTQYVHGHKVDYDDGDHNAKGAYSYLENHLSASEAEPLFSEAKSHGSVSFVSHEGHHFKLKRSGDGYFIEHNSSY